MNELSAFGTCNTHRVQRYFLMVIKGSSRVTFAKFVRNLAREKYCNCAVIKVFCIMSIYEYDRVVWRKEIVHLWRTSMSWCVIWVAYVAFPTWRESLWGLHIGCLTGRRFLFIPYFFCIIWEGSNFERRWKQLWNCVITSTYFLMVNDFF